MASPNLDTAPTSWTAHGSRTLVRLSCLLLLLSSSSRRRIANGERLANLYTTHPKSQPRPATFSATNARADGHEGAEGAAALHHGLGHLRQQFAAAQTQSGRRERETMLLDISIQEQIKCNNYRRAVKPPKRPPEARPTHAPITKPYLILSQHDGCCCCPRP